MANILQPIYITTSAKKQKTAQNEKFRKVMFRVSKDTYNAIMEDYQNGSYKGMADYYNSVVNDFKYMAYSDELKNNPMGYKEAMKQLLRELEEVDEEYKTEIISFRVRKEVFNDTVGVYEITAKRLKKLIPHIVLYHGLTLRHNKNNAGI